MGGYGQQVYQWPSYQSNIPSMSYQPESYQDWESFRPPSSSPSMHQGRTRTDVTQVASESSALMAPEEGEPVGTPPVGESPQQISKLWLNLLL